MQATNSNELMLDPLAGCLPIMQTPGSDQNFISSVLMRLRLCTSAKISESIFEQVKKEAKRSGIYPSEYIINELLYEFRKARRKHEESFEVVVLKNWTSKVIRRHGEDAGLVFFKVVSAAREKRKR